MSCRHCNSEILKNFLDLGHAPPSNSYVPAAQALNPEIYLPLRVNVCSNCFLVQTDDFGASEDYFSNDYAYFSSISTSWLDHAKKFTQMISEKCDLRSTSFVVEVASNDGYLLNNFVKSGVPCLGIEPTQSTATVAKKLGIPVLSDFFSERLGRDISAKFGKADLIIGNNVFAHVPDINDFARGLKVLLKPGGTVTLEFAHLMELMRYSQFDTIYHEHFSYLSLKVVCNVFRLADLRVFDVEKLSTHGGSLRIYGCHIEDLRGESCNVQKVIDEETEFGLTDLTTYSSFQGRAESIKNKLLRFLLDAKLNHQKVVGYGAAAKGNTLLNFSGIKSDLLPVIFDAAPSKQDMLAPGSRIPIKAPSDFLDYQPDFVLILPWNLKDEIIESLKKVLPESTKFVVPIPELNIL